MAFLRSSSSATLCTCSRPLMAQTRDRRRPGNRVRCRRVSRRAHAAPECRQRQLNLTRLGHERVTLAAVHGSDLLY
jgi:hypothetical protein